MWTGYLLLAAVASLGSIASAPFLTPDIYRPAAALLMAATALGVAVFWPMVRLSQMCPPESPRRAVVLDSFAILLPLHATIWPQAMPALSSWDASVVAAVACHSTAWLAFTGGVLAFALIDIRQRESVGGRISAKRASWMLLILLLCIAGPLAMMLRGMSSGPPMPERSQAWFMLMSPVSAIFEITRDRSWLGTPAVVQPDHWRACGLILAAAGVAWLCATLRGLHPRVDHGHPQPPDAPPNHDPQAAPAALPGPVVEHDRPAFN